MFYEMVDEINPTTLYVGNLNLSVSEELLTALFSQIGEVYSCKVIREPGCDPYAFVDFASHQAATTALAVMNKRVFLGKEIRVNWASSPGQEPKVDTSSHHHIFVGDLSPEIDSKALKEAFAPFGEITNCRIVRDPQTLKSKGYAFLSFVKKSEAENAILSMNGQWLGSRSIRTNWSIRKPPPPRETRSKKVRTITYEEVFNQASPTNTTVYCGGFYKGVTEEIIYELFAPFGDIVDTRIFRDKGYAFIKFTSKESAARAIEGTHNREVEGQTIKCYWGKENDPYATKNDDLACLNTFWFPAYQQLPGLVYPQPAPPLPPYPGPGHHGAGFEAPWPPSVSPLSSFRPFVSESPQSPMFLSQ